MAVLPPFTPPAITHSLAVTQRWIQFRHPAYPDSTPALLLLETTEGDGIDFDIAQTACCIVTGTRWEDGYLALKVRAGALPFQRVDRPEDGILRGEEYFFCVKGQEPMIYKYPVIPSFQHWRFPHDDLPPLWKRLRLPEFISPSSSLSGPAAVIQRDISCRVSGYTDAVEKAHLIPLGERFWFVSNQMERYCRPPSVLAPINSQKNILLLRKDLHHLFDGRRFTFVPKTSGTSALESESVELAIHVLQTLGSPEFVGLYHNRSPQPIRGISVECLFARFAWALFTDEIMPFFGADERYAVRLWNKNGSTIEVQTLAGTDVGSKAQIFDLTQSTSRSVSPERRSLSTRDNCGYDDWSDDRDNSPDEVDYDEPPRGRSLKRNWESSGCGDAQVPSLSISSGPDGQASQPPTPIEESGEPAPFSAAPGDNTTTTSLRPKKRIHVDDGPSVKCQARLAKVDIT